VFQFASCLPNRERLIATRWGVHSIGIARPNCDNHGHGRRFFRPRRGMLIREASKHSGNFPPSATISRDRAGARCEGRKEWARQTLPAGVRKSAPFLMRHVRQERDPRGRRGGILERAQTQACWSGQGDLRHLRLAGSMTVPVSTKCRPDGTVLGGLSARRDTLEPRVRRRRSGSGLSDFVRRPEARPVSEKPVTFWRASDAPRRAFRSLKSLEKRLSPGAIREKKPELANGLVAARRGAWPERSGVR